MCSHIFILWSLFFFFYFLLIVFCFSVYFFSEGKKCKDEVYAQSDCRRARKNIVMFHFFFTLFCFSSVSIHHILCMYLCLIWLKNINKLKKIENKFIKIQNNIYLLLICVIIIIFFRLFYSILCSVIIISSLSFIQIKFLWYDHLAIYTPPILCVRLILLSLIAQFHFVLVFFFFVCLFDHDELTQTIWLYDVDAQNVQINIFFFCIFGGNLFVRCFDLS